MPIIPSQKNALVLLRGFRDELETRTNMTNFDSDSKIRALSDVFVDDALASREDMVSAFYSMQIANAVRTQLDQIGQNLGLSRLQSTFANTLSTEQNVAFYVDGATFGAINGGAPITLTTGTRIESLPNQNELGTRISYELLDAVSLPAADAIKYVLVRAVTIGSGLNVGGETIRSHTFTSYTDVGSNSLKVINFYPILNGRDTETDEHYRFRLSQRYNSLLQTNNTRIRLQALIVPGVVETRVVPGYYGIGSAAAIVLGPENQTSPRLVQGVQEQLTFIAAPGQNIIAQGATQVLFDFKMDAKLSINPSLTEQTRITAQIRRGILQYFRNSHLGGVIDLRNVATSIQNATNGTVSLTTLTQDKLFKKVYVRKSQPGFVSDDRELLITNTVSLELNEFGALGTLEVNYI